MEKDDFTIASSLMRERIDVGASHSSSSASPATSTRTQSQSMRVTDVKEKEKRLYGMQAVAASLTSDQWHRNPSTQAGPSTATSASAELNIAAWHGVRGGGRGREGARHVLAEAYAAAALPDMFGVNNNNNNSALSVREDVLGNASGQAWADAMAVHPPLRLRRRCEVPRDSEDADTSEDARHESLSHSRGAHSGGGGGGKAVSKLPAMCAWYRVPRRPLTAHGVSPPQKENAQEPIAPSGELSEAQGRERGYLWVRQDDLVEDELLLASAMETSKEDVLSLAVSAGAGCSTVPFGQPCAGLGPQPAWRDFFSFSAEEYHAALESTVEEEEEDGSCERDEAGRFTFESTCKLFRLYELFGSFPVVADRWACYDDAGMPLTGASTPSIRRDGAGGGSGAAKRSRDAAADDSTFFHTPLRRTDTFEPHAQSLDAPRVETLCAHYTHISTAIMRCRHARLGALLHSPAPSREAACPSPASTRAKREEESAVSSTPTPPLLQFFEKHPLWRCEPAEHGNRSVPDARLTVNAHTPLAELVGQYKTPSAVLTALSTASPWYNGRQERQRRDALAELLLGEAAVNVPYQRAVAAYMEALKPAAQHLERARQMLVGLPFANPGDTTAATGMGVREDAETLTDVNGGRGDRRTAPLALTISPAALSVVWRDLPAGADPVMLRETQRAVRAHNSTHSLRQPAAEDDLADGRSTSPQSTRAVESSTTQPKGKRGSRRPFAQNQAGSTTSGRASAIAAVLDEVVNRVPWECARLVGAARAGWMLLPPRPLAVSSSHAARSETNAHGTPPPPTTATTTTTSSLLHRVHAAGIVNRATSTVSESILLTYTASVPRLYREVEQELEKHLLEDHRALMTDGAHVVTLSESIRCLYTQNLLLRRAAQRLEGIVESIEKISS